MNKKKDEKEIYIEILRIVACFFVLYNHTDGYRYYMTEEYNPVIWIHMFLSMFCKLSVPLFLMISGVVLLEKKESIGTIYRKRLCKIAAILFVVNAYFYYKQGGISFSYFLSQLISNSVDNTIAYWYLYEYISFLIMLPFTRIIANNMDNSHYIYLLIIHVILYILFPMFSYFIPGMRLSGNIYVSYAISQSIIYPLIGYYFGRRIGINTIKGKHCIYAGILMIVCIFIESKYTIVFGESGNYSEEFTHMFPHIIAITVLVITRFIVDKLHKSVFVENLIVIFGGLTFGIYLLDPIMHYYIYKYFDFNRVGVISGSILYCLVSFLVCGCMALFYKYSKKIIVDRVRLFQK